MSVVALLDPTHWQVFHDLANTLQIEIVLHITLNFTCSLSHFLQRHLTGINPSFKGMNNDIGCILHGFKMIVEFWSHSQWVRFNRIMLCELNTQKLFGALCGTKGYWNTWQFNSAKTIFAFSSPPQMRRRAKLFVSCCRPYLVHQYTILPFSNLHLPGEIFTCKGVKS